MATSQKTNQLHFGRPVLKKRYHQQDVAAAVKKSKSLKEHCRGCMVSASKDAFQVHTESPACECRHIWSSIKLMEHYLFGADVHFNILPL